MLDFVNQKEMIREMTKTLSSLERKQIPYAVRSAFNNTVYQVRKDLQEDIADVFDRPTPFIKNSILFEKVVKGSQLEDMSARVYIRGRSSKGNPERALDAQITGGDRKLKASERAFRQAGILPSGHYIVPGPAIRLNKYGNITGQAMMKILSALQAQRDTRQNSARMGRTNNQKSSVRFFVVTKGGKPIGIGQRTGRTFKGMLLLFISSKPSYSKRFDFVGLAKQSAELHFPTKMHTSLRRALATAR